MGGCVGCGVAEECNPSEHVSLIHFAWNETAR